MPKYQRISNETAENIFNKSTEVMALQAVVKKRLEERIRIEQGEQSPWKNVGISGGMRERGWTPKELKLMREITDKFKAAHNALKHNPEALYLLLTAFSKNVRASDTTGNKALLNTVEDMHAGFKARGQASSNPFTKLAVASNFWGHKQHRTCAKHVLSRVKTYNKEGAEAARKTMGLS